MFQPQIIYEDNHLLVINKRAGEIIQGDRSGDVPLIELYKQYIKEKYAKPGNVFLGLPHRLDRPVSGVCVLARTSKTLVRLNTMFLQHNDMDKCYWALVPRNDSYVNRHTRLENWLVRNEKQNKSYVSNETRTNAKLAILEFKVIKTYERWMLLEVHLHTGRHHQIRCQLANIGLPIRGDLKYGAQRSMKDGSICLHARSLRILHPVRKETLVFEAPAPQSFDL